ncbi:unnamed protein product [Symbiodinium sp. CCMP2456]|nr:unnamed protein product [Symbiodinium sp. CCMP2456]
MEASLEDSDSRMQAEAKASQVLGEESAGDAGGTSVRPARERSSQADPAPPKAKSHVKASAKDMRPVRLRPWRKTADEVRSEVEAADRILFEGQTAAAAAAGIDAAALRFFFLALQTVEEASAALPGRRELERSLDALRQAATSSASKEEVNSALQAASTAVTAAGLEVSLSRAPKQDLCHQVLPWLLIGGWAALGRDCDELRRRSVTHVVSIISADQRKLPEFVQGHLHIFSFDSEDAAQKLGERFPDICRFIDGRGERGKVYVHCGAGISRAPTAAASYIMWKLGVSAAVAIRLIRAARPCIRPNVGFVRELQKWEKKMTELQGFASCACTAGNRLAVAGLCQNS